MYQCRPHLGVDFCWNVPARGIDRAVAALFLGAITPLEIELALAVVREAERQGSDVDRPWKLRLVVGGRRDEAQLAERRCQSHRPRPPGRGAHARREWNDRARVDSCPRRWSTLRASTRRSVGERRSIPPTTTALGTRARAQDLPAVWNAETTTHAERKNLLRMVVREVTVSPIEVPARQVRVPLQWQTEAVSDFTLPRKDKYTAQATPTATIDLLRDLYLVRDLLWRAWGWPTAPPGRPRSQPSETSPRRRPSPAPGLALRLPTPSLAAWTGPAHPCPRGPGSRPRSTFPSSDDGHAPRAVAGGRRGAPCGLTARAQGQSRPPLPPREGFWTAYPLISRYAREWSDHVSPTPGQGRRRGDSFYRESLASPGTARNEANDGHSAPRHCLNRSKR